MTAGTRYTTDVRTVTFAELLASLEIDAGGAEGIFVAAKADGKLDGTLTITTKRTEEIQ